MTTRNLWIFLGPTVSTFLLLSAAASRASAEAVTETIHIVIPIDARDIDPCTGDRFTLNGHLRFVFHTTTDANGGTHMVGHGSAHAWGIGESGTRYEFADVGNTNIITVAGRLPLIENHVLTHRVISQGKAANFLLFEHLHLTVNANGDITVFFDVSTSRCT